MKRWVPFLLGCAASAGCILWLTRRTDLAAVAPSLRTVGWSAWLAAIGVYLLSFVPRTLRWRLMLAPAGRFRLADLGKSIVLGYAGNNVLPFRLGEFVRAAVFGRLTGASKTVGLGSVAAERLLDGFTISVVLCVVLAGSAGRDSTPERLRPVLLGAAVIVGIGLAGLLVAWFATKPLVALAGRLSPKCGAAAAKAAQAIQFLRRPRLLLAVVVFSGLVWAVEGAVFVILCHGLGLPAPWTVGFLSLAVVNLGILVPAAPGYVGVFQAAAVLAFAAGGRSADEGLAFGLLVHSAQFLPVTLLGLVLAVPLWPTVGDLLRSKVSSSHA